jgi:hypothetical protein
LVVDCTKYLTLLAPSINIFLLHKTCIINERR